MNYRMILYTIGWALNIEGACLLLPLICSAIYKEPYVLTFAFCMIVCLVFGFMLTVKTPKNKSMYAKEGFVIVALSWIFISLFGCLPFVLSGYIPNFVDALFETVSGFTTTGATILSDVEMLPKGLLFWRSFTHWIGGMGVLVFLVAILPLSGGSNLYLIKAESTGPAVSKLVPTVKSTAKLLYGMYIFLTVLEIILLLIGKMNLFEALTLSFGTAGTGGFGILNSSFAEYSPYVQNIATIFMLLFGVDFSLYYLIIMKKFKIALKSEEVRAYFLIVLVSSLLICFNCASLFESLATSFRHSIFQVASIITTTGFATVDFDKWPEFSKTILVVLMFIGACAGSTGGGIKISRIIILLKSIVKEIKIAVHPKRVYKTTMNGKLVEHETVRAINVFMVAYIAIYVASMLIISIDNMDFTTNFTAVAATINNIGPGLAGVGPTQTFAAFSPLSKVVFIFNMIAGRLEIFPVLILFSLPTWKK